MCERAEVDGYYLPPTIENNGDGTYSCALNVLKSGEYYVDIKVWAPSSRGVSCELATDFAVLF